jgi:hypothetical protein
VAPNAAAKNASRRKFVLLSEQLGLRVAFGALRPKPLFEQLGLRVAFGALRPKPLFEQLGLRVASSVLERVEQKIEANLPV